MGKEAEVKDRIKCAFCDYWCNEYYTLKNGKVKPGIERLRNHVIDRHSDEWDKIVASSQDARQEQAGG